MAPDLNSLSPPNNTTTQSSPQNMTQSSSLEFSPRGQVRDVSPSPSPRSASVSLQAAATLNAGLQRGDPGQESPNGSLSQRRPSMSTGRRRSQVLMNLQMADPATPAPGEMVPESPIRNRGQSPFHTSGSSPQLIPSRNPQHVRAPSLGELHQELENEQEYQVNRLLSEIRRLQLQVQRHESSSSAIGDELSDRPATPSIPPSGPQSAHPTTTPGSSVPRSPGFSHHPRASFDMARPDRPLIDPRRSSRTPSLSRGASPRLRSTSIGGDSGEQWVLGGRDESAFYQAETQMLTRENQMLRHRIRDLERQLSEVSGAASNSSITHEPSHASRLHRSMSVSDDDASRPQLPPATHLLPTVADTQKEV